MWAMSNNSGDLVAHSTLEAVILERTAELRDLSQRLLKVQDEERRKLARDLHDSTGQTLVALKISVSLLKSSCSQEGAIMALVSDVSELADQAMQEIRTMSYLLHPPLLDEAGFACAAEWYVEGFAKRSGIRVSLDIENLGQRLPEAMEIGLFRVLQESLTNVHRHSGALEASVSFRKLAEDMVLEVRDYGHGMSAEPLERLRGGNAGTGVGLAGMRERLHELHGKLEIESNRQGTTMRAVVPISAISRSDRTDDRVQVTAASLLQRAKDVLEHKRPGRAVMTAGLALVVLICMIAYNRHVTLFSVHSERQKSISIEEQALRRSAKTAPGTLQAMMDPMGKAMVVPLRRRFGFGEDAVVQIGDDVTVRYFHSQAQPHVPAMQYQVRRIGEDVTVRYLTPISSNTGN
jgi:anti-sigma regulatory factor (Ser/Thr protein kinase)